ncbi:glycine-rich RNA-binding protein 2, mitochondrial-like [Mercurialis annua]|uniref:glycine-rich RNA-binding protein 2, mitochondrial-like n=1 Tax=Mercurialis annua TaxID=3986 RepID=UPI00215E7594|nr:glycine-rich RNA-binding protein 2, mitochondrial-like [Mercurialis annua]XP_050220178.1 glycine-rich RNA-binding protein 2, mitochondrial-like [Mercurialis annua]
MAFCNKIGALVRQSMSQNVKVPVMLNSFRAMSSSKLFVGGLSYGTTDESLKEAFSGFGDVVSARVITDRDTGRSRGFGFVDYSSNDCASSALSSMDGQELNGRNIRVSYATERTGGGGGGGPRSFNNNFRGNNSGFGNEGF